MPSTWPFRPYVCRSSTEGEDKIEQLYIHYSVEGYASQQAPSNEHLESVDLDTIFYSADGCEGKTLLLEQIIKTGLDHVMPMRTRKVYSTEPPWITSSLMNLLQKWQSPLSRGDDQMFRQLRNRVDRERKMCRANYYQAKVQHLKKCKPYEWWKEVKKLSGCSLAFTDQSDTLKSLQRLHEGIDQIGLANIINEACLLYTSPSPRDLSTSRMPSSA